MLRIPLLSKEEIARRRQYRQRLANLEKQFATTATAAYGAFAREMRAQTAKYLIAAWDYRHRPARQAKLTLAQFAARKGLYAFALGQWLDYLGMGEYRLMTKPVTNVAGKVGVHAWKGEPDCPSLTVNSTAKEVAILTFKLPPKSVAVHPGPKNGVAVGWKSPITGTARVTGKVADADPVAGDGIAWVIDHRTAGGRQELATGDIPNGGAQPFSSGKGAKNLTSVRVKAGDRIELLVLPKANYVCDTTVVELVIAKTDGSARWDLTRDIVSDLHQKGQGNPHRDGYGNKAVWHFSDMAKTFRTNIPAAIGQGAMAEWHRVLAQGGSGKFTHQAIEAAALAFQKKFDLADQRSPFWIKDAADHCHLPPETQKELARLAGQIAQLKKNPPPPAPFANGAQEGGVPGSPHAGIHDVRIHIRGSYARLGPLIRRRFPLILAGHKQPPIKHGSGRLQLARWIASPANPLTARVMVNRLWQYHFGEGIVRTPSNFGKLGERPTHPKLLDYLAHKLVESGWSLKKMHRMIMLSAAYRQASVPDPATLKADPDNRLFGRMNRRRLEAEAIRDSLLAVAGRLGGARGGRATRDFSSPRRTLYLMTIRSDRSGFRPLFDVADPTAPVDKRVVSTVAPQALFLLNHPFVMGQTQALAGWALRVRGSDARRVEQLYLRLFGRPPLKEEARIGLDFLNWAVRARKSIELAWEEYCQVLLCTNEFIYVD
jgi:hypothetical protein